jgi:hypothetical protein
MLTEGKGKPAQARLTETMMQKKHLLMAVAGAFVLAAGVGQLAYADRGPGAAGGHGTEMMGMPSFEAMDADKDGNLTLVEVEAYRAAQIAKADVNSDGKLNADELVTLQEAERAARMATHAAQMIERFDGDADGLLSPEELAAGPRAETMFERIDADGDGSVTAAEMQAAKMQMAGRMIRGGRHGQHDGGAEIGPEFGPEN